MPKQKPVATTSGTTCENSEHTATDNDVPTYRKPAYRALLSRVFEQDIGACTKCGGKLRLIACINKPDAIAKIIEHLGLPKDTPQLAPARVPPQLIFDDDWSPGPVENCDDYFAA